MDTGEGERKFICLCNVDDNTISFLHTVHLVHIVSCDLGPGHLDHCSEPPRQKNLGVLVDNQLRSEMGT